MCHHCEEDDVLRIRWIDEEDLEYEDETVACEWVDDEVEDPAEDADEFDLASCGEDAEFLVQMQMIDEHVCARCASGKQAALEAGLGDFLEELGMQDAEEFLPLAPLELALCDECGDRATLAHRVVYTQCLCPEHALASGAKLPPRD